MSGSGSTSLDTGTCVGKIDNVDAPSVSLCKILFAQPAVENFGGHGNELPCTSFGTTQDAGDSKLERMENASLKLCSKQVDF